MCWVRDGRGEGREEHKAYGFGKHKGVEEKRIYIYNFRNAEGGNDIIS